MARRFSSSRLPGEISTKRRRHIRETASNATHSNFESAEHFAQQVNLIRRGDIIGVTGQPYRTKAGELSLSLTNMQLLSPCLHQLPPVREGLSDLETRYRKRYVDLIMNSQTRDVFVARSKVVNYIRKFLDNLGFLEVSLIAHLCVCRMCSFC